MFHGKAEQRKQLHQIDSKSPFFTRAEAKSPTEVIYGESIGSNHYSRKPRIVRRSSCFSFRLFVIWTAMLGGFGYYWFIRVSLPQVRLDIRKEEADTVKHHWKQEAVALEAKLKDLEKENKRLTGSLSFDSQTWLIKLDHAKADLQMEQERNKEWQDKANRLEERVEESAVKLQEATLEMEHAISKYSRRAVLEKFGPGPHRVEVEVNFPVNQEHNWYFMLELAPIDEMPHSVHIFLEQVTRGLFDNGGYSFYSNAGHVIQGGALPNHVTRSDNGNVAGKFEESGFAHVLFQEYSENFPHEKYTLGFTGRPGGPSIYINTKDNIRDHGPNGYSKDGKGDPCFAKVIRGYDVVDRMHQASGEIKEGEWKHTEGGSIAVRSMKHLPP